MREIFLAAFFLLLTGCATSWDVKLNDSDNEAIMNGQDNSADIVNSKTKSIEGVNLTSSTDPVAIALFQVLKTQAIAGIETPMFEVKKARLNTDNVPAVAEVLGHGFTLFTVGKVATTAIENDRGTTTMNSEGGDIAMSDSLNRSEVHATANDGSSATTTNSGNSEAEESSSVPYYPPVTEY